MKRVVSSKRLPWSALFWVAVLVTTISFAAAQNPPGASPSASNPHSQDNADEIARILGISQLLSQARAMRSQTPCGAAPAVEELSVRHDILETVLAAAFEIDGVLAELDNERAHLSELSMVLQSRRDRGVNLINAANLVTGSGLGIAVNAMQFSSSTANVGNGIGVGSGVGSTVLAIIGIHLQRGPQRSVGRIPNMLAPLFGRRAALNSYYPQAVLEYLQSVPPSGPVADGSRLDQLMNEWRQAGRVGPPGSATTDQQITRLTSSMDDKTKLSIDDLSNRMAMLGDVTGRVALMKRDLGDLMLSVGAGKRCAAPGHGD